MDMNTFHFIAIMIIAMCIGLIYLIDKAKKNKLELGMQRAAGIIAVVMLLTVNLPVLATLYEEIMTDDDQSNSAYYCDEEENNIKEDEEGAEYIYEEKREKWEYKEIVKLGGYIPIMPLLTSIDFPTGAITVANGETVEIVAGAVVTGDITVQAGGILYIEDGAIVNARVITSGNFTMNGGIISGNTATVGGGVDMVGGTFTMNGGEIRDNIATGWGGGVRVFGGIFTMNGGEIHNNTVSGTNWRCWTYRRWRRSTCRRWNIYNEWRRNPQ